MRTIYIIVEGPTEEEFVNNSVSTHLRNFGIINTIPVPLETSPGYFGGDLSFSRYLSNVQKLLQSDPTAIVTSIIDFYELRTDFPGYNDAMNISNKIHSVEFIEDQIMNNVKNDRFIPYIQLHEFEGLLFSDIRGFQNFFPSVVNHAQYIINHFPNPELINNGPTTHPSARLKDIFSKNSIRYKKTFHGPLIAIENGINSIIIKCPRFRIWIENIILKGTS